MYHETMIIAHRGASAYSPENTVAAIIKAFELGADGIEIDVQMSRDGELFLHHDWTLEKLGSETSLVISKTLSELKKLDAGKWFAPEFAGERIPTLSEALSAVPKGKIVNIEIKKTAADSRDIESKVVRCIRDMKIADDIIISSFNHQTIAKIQKSDPDIKTALIISSLLAEPMKYFGNFTCYSIHPLFYFADPKLIEVLHSNNIKIYPWVVNVPEYAGLLMESGCDGIITNYPDLRF
jgi:glycerophosphoryl diester phosphodiesterase